ncbi:alpha/beta hydrolase [Arthrobacter livingstonensis]|uniref:Alpha/beta hydrolase n=1 Tax=Arthrobacter livingstonensis TaxID=670078 RepID=A0A2V5LAY1_9MICC|nr:alpha/beta hydrolase [Arthrobacter livingstonensis]PYI68508.1 alpha/beta hydrolase [Arthrobacter livingstonensis]
MANIVLVHGLWSDGSSWLRVIAELRALGHDPVAAQLGLESFDDDVASVRRTLATVEGPVLLVGWSYGGAVMGEAARESVAGSGGAGAGKVKALAYVAAFAPAEGESVTGLSRRHPGSLIPQHVVIAGNYTYIDRAHFGEVIAAELSAESAAIGAAVQKLTRIGLDRAAVGRPAWLDLPTHYLLTTRDAAVPPALQREMAARMGAAVTEIDSSHAPVLTRPREVAAFLDTACASLAG